MIGKPPRKSAPPTARRPPPTAAASNPARWAAMPARFGAGQAAELLRLAANLTAPAARWHPDAARALAFNTPIPAGRAVALLCMLPPAALHPGARHAQNVAAAKPAEAVADRWNHLMRAEGLTW